MSLAEWRRKDARAIVENLGQEVATMEHFGVGPVGENGPLEAVNLSRERLGCEPVADSTFAIVVPAVVFRTVAAFLKAVVQIRPFVVNLEVIGRTPPKGKINMTTADINYPQVVAREEWLNARVDLLEREKELTRVRDRINTVRRELPMVRIEEKYVFDSPDGPKSLLDLFAGRLQL